MSEAELLEATTAYYDLGISAASLFVTVLSGYLMIAYFLGRSLSTTQLWIINTLFFFVASTSGTSTILFSSRALAYASEVRAISSSALPFETTSATTILGMAAIALAGVTLTAYYFMWSTRRSDEPDR